MIYDEAALARAVARGKQEILSDVKAGLVPKSVQSFSDLHAWRDANAYGGAFEDEDYDASDDTSVRFWSRVQDELNAWIVWGGLR